MYLILLLLILSHTSNVYSSSRNMAEVPTNRLSELEEKEKKYQTIANDYESLKNENMVWHKRNVSMLQKLPEGVSLENFVKQSNETKNQLTAMQQKDADNSNKIQELASKLQQLEQNHQDTMIKLKQQESKMEKKDFAEQERTIKNNHDRKKTFYQEQLLALGEVTTIQYDGDNASEFYNHIQVVANQEVSPNITNLSYKQPNIVKASLPIKNAEEKENKEHPLNTSKEINYNDTSQIPYTPNANIVSHHEVTVQNQLEDFINQVRKTEETAKNVIQNINTTAKKVKRGGFFFCCSSKKK